MTSSNATIVHQAPVGDANEDGTVGKRVESSERQQHLIGVNDMSDSDADTAIATSTTDLNVDKRRGRPRLLKPRDESAIEVHQQRNTTSEAARKAYIILETPSAGTRGATHISEAQRVGNGNGEATCRRASAGLR